MIHLAKQIRLFRCFCDGSDGGGGGDDQKGWCTQIPIRKV